ncbi:hypothetical protein GCM10022237_23260 [Nocardioides ginsengisoli]|uniref:GntR family transcriptional regulator n=1 Tax=Nocardioides ginsengisoli TaxID=363868 RepID=A0ABW3W6B8_9ACTN
MSDPAESAPASLEERLERMWVDAARSGRRLPGEPALAAALSSSRPAVREALIRLEERGYIHRRKGADTTVNQALLDIPARFDRRIEESELIRAMGQEPRLDVLASAVERITLDEATTHDLSPGTAVLRVVKRWSADGVPVLLARDAVPVLQGDAGDVDPALPMVDIAVALTGERVEWEVVRPGAEAFDAEQAAQVDRPVGEPALALDVTGVARTGQVCYWTSELHVRGAFRYAMVRRADWR